MPAPRVRQSTATKVIKLLESLAEHADGVGVRDASREIGVDKSAVSRIFDQLEEVGFAVQDPVSARYHVGPRLFSLAAAIHGRDTLWQAAEPILRDLVATFNETCYLARRTDDKIVFRDKVDCTHPVRYIIDPGEHAPLHAGAGGRAILLGMDDAEIEAIIDRTGLPAVTPNTITDRDELFRQIHEDRRRGYAMSMGERVPSGSAIAAPYYNTDGTCVGSIVLTCPAERFDIRRAPQIADAVTKASRDLSRRLGYRPKSGESAADGTR